MDLCAKRKEEAAASSSFLSNEVEIDEQAHHKRDLEDENGGDAEAEGLVQRLVVPDLHAQPRADAAAHGRQQEQRPLPDAAGTPFGLPLVDAEDEKGDNADEQHPQPQQGPGRADEEEHRVGDSGGVIQRLHRENLEFTKMAGSYGGISVAESGVNGKRARKLRKNGRKQGTGEGRDPSEQAKELIDMKKWSLFLGVYLCICLLSGK